MKYDTASWLSLHYPFLIILWYSDIGSSRRAEGFSTIDYFPSMSALRTTKIKVAVKRDRHIISVLDYFNTRNCTIPMGRNDTSMEVGLLPVQ